jgi:[ribosomal protein S5]-alanine N-acetyltransferase
MASVESFATARMLATRIIESDFDDLFRLNQDPEVAKTMGGTRSEAETREFIRRAITHWETYGYGFWMFRDREDARFIGRGGLRHVEIDGAGEIEIAYAVMPKFWRCGFATEMAQAFVDIATQLGIRDLVAFTLPTNVGSRGVMEKVGFRYERDIMWADLPHVLYRRKL